MTTILDLRDRATNLFVARADNARKLRSGVARLARLVVELASPSGRCNRQIFLNIALIFLALQATVAALLWVCGVETSQTGALMLNGPILWIGATVCIKRLHDVGKRAWWIPAALALWLAGSLLLGMVVSIALGEEAMQPGQVAFVGLFLAMTLPAFGALLWLHTAPGEAGPNRFGPVPGPSGLSRVQQSPARAWRRMIDRLRARLTGSALA